MPGMRLLYIEDDDFQREQVTAILERAGHRVKSAATGLEALNHLRSFQVPDLIILDRMLQPEGLDGWNLLRQIRKDARLRTIPVLVVTGLSVATLEWAASLGASGVLKKPFEPGQLLSEVERLGVAERAVAGLQAF